MARIHFKPEKVTHEIEDGTPLIDICEEVSTSLSFGCTEGTCGVCELTVISGSKNLSITTEEEKDYLLPEDLQSGMRLGCQLKIRKGDVSITWKNNKT
ncbi:MAG: 2Fe-2S iron-sulfur cluster-binding protein [Candidatus Marinimicrobia bacterium]|jgi:ferredoxin|nr:ferredoxin [Nitrospinota bacterium]MDP7128111.1 2Fe-2S iron-sulfur cluster-binding protein [Candidatus Neomarinimicrobiota bacterium]|tara:strand:+ start:3156 stop:3449 length:294 start_codon:yes stop_codon:yes gene_type:complete